MKRKIRVIVIVVICFILILLLRVAIFLVGSHIHMLAEIIDETEQESVEYGIVYDTESITEEDGFGIGYVEKVYTDYSNEQKEFLGSRYDEYVRIFDKIEKSYSDIELKYGDYELGSEDTICTVQVDTNSKLDIQGLRKDYSAVTVKDSLTAVGFFNDVCVVYAYNYDLDDCNEFVVVDYTNTPFSLGADLISIGDIDNVFINLKNCVLTEYEGYKIVFVRG